MVGGGRGPDEIVEHGAILEAQRFADGEDPLDPPVALLGLGAALDAAVAVVLVVVVIKWAPE